MGNDLHQIAQAASQLANRLPYGVMVTLAEAVAQYGGMEWPAARGAILHCLPTMDFRDATEDFLDRWHSQAAGVEAGAVALALMTAATSQQARQEAEGIEIVWTGPEPGGTSFRQTEQAILEVVNSARQRLTVVSYAVYRIPRIAAALVEAASRGVSIRLIVETPNLIDGQNEYDCVRALGDKVASAASVFYWPQENRAKDENGKIGIMHVKCAVADGSRLFLSSANFTEYAFNINMELGLLVTGGKVPAQVDAHFGRLVEAGILTRLNRL